MSEEQRRVDLIKDLIDEVKGLRKDKRRLMYRFDMLEQSLKPVQEFMADVNAAKKAAIGIAAIIAAIGGAITWFLNLKDHVHHNG